MINKTSLQRCGSLRVGLIVALFGSVGSLGPSPSPARADTPRNVILIIGDGMGFEHVAAAGMYRHGTAGTLPFESLPYTGEATTYAANSSVTDSAAAATAMATGQKVNNGVISIALPGDGSDLVTALEIFQQRSKRTGLVSTAYVTHATPAAFGAHVASRNDTNDIAMDYLFETRPNVILGGAGSGMTTNRAELGGYTVATDRAELQALFSAPPEYVSGQFIDDHMPYEYDYAQGLVNNYDTIPHLTEMATAALDLVEGSGNGFFLMIEGGRIDHAAHGNNINRNVFETLEFSDMINLVLAWMAGRDDTLLIVTADHETGGMNITANNGAGVMPSVTWSTTGHTGQNVPVYAAGPNAEMISGVIDNTDIFDILIARTPPYHGDADGDGDVDADDYALFGICLAGPGVTPDPVGPYTAQDCLDAFDFDTDADVDLRDFESFGRAYSP